MVAGDDGAFVGNIDDLWQYGVDLVRLYLCDTVESGHCSPLQTIIFAFQQVKESVHVIGDHTWFNVTDLVEHLDAIVADAFILVRHVLNKFAHRSRIFCCDCFSSKFLIRNFVAAIERCSKFRDNAHIPFGGNCIRIMTKSKVITEKNMPAICRELARSDEQLGFVHSNYGTPPLWARPTGFATLLNIILEQQVSLASAKACFANLTDHLGVVTAEQFLTINDTDLKTIGFSRQKIAYARHLSEAVIEKHIDLDAIHVLPDDEVKAELIKLKGIGVWTADVYLLMAMLRPDVMPRGDIALHAAFQKLTGADKRPDSDEFIEIAERWRPFRSVAARLLWHFYLSERKRRSNHIES